MMKFNGGQVVATAGVSENLTNSEISKMLGRHFNGDWGDTCIEDSNMNDEAIAHEGDRRLQDRVMSSYRADDNQTVWVITEWDRSATTVLYPSEY